MNAYTRSGPILRTEGFELDRLTARNGHKPGPVLFSPGLSLSPQRDRPDNLRLQCPRGCQGPSSTLRTVGTICIC